MTDFSFGFTIGLAAGTALGIALALVIVANTLRQVTPLLPAQDLEAGE